MSRIAFQVADDPFFKSARARFFPEVVVMNMKGEIKAVVNSSNRKYVRNGQEALNFEEDFREPKLKINDDRKVDINLNQLLPKDKNPKKHENSSSALSNKFSQQQPISGKMILLTVKIAAENFKSAPVRPGEYDRAWYRLVNSETS